MIKSLEVVRILDKEPRTKGKCSECEKVRLRTEIHLRDDDQLVIEYLCNECLTRTPPWGS